LARSSSRRRFRRQNGPLVRSCRPDRRASKLSVLRCDADRRREPPGKSRGTKTAARTTRGTLGGVRNADLRVRWAKRSGPPRTTAHFTATTS
jgi:hypothetical protein